MIPFHSNGHQDVYTAVDTAQIRDVEVFSILSPNDTVSCGLITPLSATVCNSGNRIESFDVIGLIDSSGSPLFWDTVKVMGLEPDSCVIVNFNDWLVPNVDSTCYTFTVFTQLPIDETPGNDTLSKGFCALCTVGIEERSKFETGSKKFQLFQNSPNPFSAAGERPTIIGYALPQSTQMTLKIYDVTGKTVKTLVEGKQDKGFNRVRWDGRNENGKKVPTGVYFYKLKAGGLTETRKIILLR
ncbi:T9SS type A sorting domain-containing protein [candidate division TA06 bacterium]|nr:T9SS type A sorting domain-containing protein [candidate division TA06 bacterium]